MHWKELNPTIEQCLIAMIVLTAVSFGQIIQFTTRELGLGFEFLAYMSPPLVMLIILLGIIREQNKLRKDKHH